VVGGWNGAIGSFPGAPNHTTGTPDAPIFDGNGTRPADTHAGIVVLIGLNRAPLAADSSYGGFRLD
jgi:hypothetical protein